MHQWPESHAEQTDVLPPVAPPQQHGTPQQHGDATTQVVAAPGPPTGRPRWRRPAIIAGSVLGGLVLLYGIDLALSSGEVPRGVTVAGVDVGGMDRADAEAKLHAEIEPRLNRPITVRAGDAETTLNPQEAGLRLDWPATLDQAGTQPLNPITRLTSFFTTREVGVATTVDNTALFAAIEQIRGDLERKPAEGTIRFDGITPVVVEPEHGITLDVGKTRQVIIDRWASGEPIDVPARTTPTKTTAEGVRQALADLAQPAVSGPVTVHGDGADATLTPKQIAGALSFEPADGGGLTLKLNEKKLTKELRPQLASTEKKGRDAEIVFAGGEPTVRPSAHGRGVDWKSTLGKLPDVLVRTEDRELDADYKDKPADVTTKEAKALGIKEVIGEFTTGGFAPDSGVNIRTVAAEVDGAIVKPGDTFSLNGYTGPRTEAQGYIAAGIILDGAPSRAVGGGISQFATTLYNAAYFAAMTDAGHTEHSYYISRYPEAREATVFQNPDGSSVVDLKFTNDSPTGIAIQTIWTPSSITVKIWGTKHYEVQSVTGQRHDFVDPPVRRGPAEDCVPSTGSPGFTTSDTRIVRDADTGEEVSRHTRTVHYNPSPTITCKQPKPRR